MDSVVEVKFEGLEKRLDKVEESVSAGLDKIQTKIEQRDHRIYGKIDALRDDVRSDITRLQLAGDARCTRHMDSQHKQFQDIAAQIGALSAQLQEKPNHNDITETKMDITEIRAEQRNLKERQKALRKMEKDSIPPTTLLDPKRFLSAPWMRILLAVIAAATTAVTVWAKM